jgi:hypothetical protein
MDRFGKFWKHLWLVVTGTMEFYEFPQKLGINGNFMIHEGTTVFSDFY